MDRDQSIYESFEGPQSGAEIIDHVNEHLRRWEQILRRIDPDGFCISLTSCAGLSDHFVVFDHHEGVRRLKEVQVNESVSSERLLVNAPRGIRVEVLRRLPKALEGLIIRKKHGNG